MLTMRVTPKISDSPAPTKNRLDAAARPLSAWNATASRVMGAKPEPAPSLLPVRAVALDHPPLEGEGRTAEGSPGWGDGDAANAGHAACAEALSPPPGPLARADLPPPGGGSSRRVSCNCLTVLGERHIIITPLRPYRAASSSRHQPKRCITGSSVTRNSMASSVASCQCGRQAGAAMTSPRRHSNRSPSTVDAPSPCTTAKILLAVV